MRTQNRLLAATALVVASAVAALATPVAAAAAPAPSSGSAVTAASRHEVIPAPAGAVGVKPGQSVARQIRLADGTVATVTVKAGPRHTVDPATLGLSKALRAGTTCWSASGYVYYGGSGSAEFFSFHDDVSWCGDGSTMQSPGQNVYGIIDPLGIADQWQYDGIIGGPNATQFYGGWAYQTFVQGKFEQCILKIGCTQISAQPIIWWNLYADGGTGFYWQG
jgi:hypothetical protein